MDSPRVALLALLGGGVLVALGAVVGDRLGGPAARGGLAVSPIDASSASPLADPGLTAALADLADELRALREARAFEDPARSVAAGGDTAGTGGAARDDVLELAQAIERLADAVATRGPGEAGVARVVGLEVAGGFANLADLVTHPEEEWSRPHMFWTLKQVVDRYGLPHRIDGNAGSSWLVYLNPQTRDPRDNEIAFLSREGLVIRVEEW